MNTGDVVPEPIECFACGVEEGRPWDYGRPAKIIRFGLRDSKRETTAGGIFLCERCWRQAQNIRPRRGYPFRGHRKSLSIAGRFS
jgi:hypothetical protein